MRVLIADDEAVSRRMLQSYLGQWGYVAATAENGVDALELVRRVRAAPRAGYVYAILLTAKSQKEDLVEGMDAGADDFLTKPFDRDELRVRLRAGERIIQLEHDVH